MLLAGVIDDLDQLPGFGAQGPGEMVGGLTLDHQRAVADLVSGDEESWHGSMVARLSPDAIPPPGSVPYDREPWHRLLPTGTWSRATVSGSP